MNSIVFSDMCRWNVEELLLTTLNIWFFLCFIMACFYCSKYPQYFCTTIQGCYC